ncbi:unnamed protein product [Prorocentrum cordatum]|uniref:Uncharacterized protein n=1 Tax=Prorocentrum cordatum TaxID=2364126 RepID=A0ABN9TKA7_9DINO|nr:unnamed protein product [Polarella glacialis]
MLHKPADEALDWVAVRHVRHVQATAALVIFCQRTHQPSVRITVEHPQNVIQDLDQYICHYSTTILSVKAHIRRELALPDHRPIELKINQQVVSNCLQAAPRFNPTPSLGLAPPVPSQFSRDLMDSLDGARVPNTQEAALLATADDDIPTIGGGDDARAAVEKRKKIHGAEQSDAIFAAIFKKVDAKKSRLSQVLATPVAKNTGLVADTEKYAQIVERERPDWSSDLKRIGVAALCMYRSRSVDVGTVQHVQMIWIILGDRLLRAHNGRAYFYAERLGYFDVFGGLLPPELLFAASRFMLTLEGIFRREVPSGVERMDSAVITAIDSTVENAVAKISGDIPYAAKEAAALVSFRDNCDTMRSAGVADEDCIVKYDVLGNPVTFSSGRSPENSVYIGIRSQPLSTDPVLDAAVARVQKIYSQTFWPIPDAFVFGQAAQALAKRGYSVDTITMHWGPGGVGLSLLTSHLEAMYGHKNHKYFDPNIIFVDDELRKVVELLVDGFIFTSQDSLKKFATAEGVSGRLPHPILTKMFRIVGCTRLEVNKFLVFDDITEQNVESLMRRLAAVKIQARLFDRVHVEKNFGDAAAAGIFARDPDAKEFLMSSVGVAAGHRVQFAFEDDNGAEARRDIIVRHARCGGDRGITEKSPRQACGLLERTSNAAGPLQAEIDAPNSQGHGCKVPKEWLDFSMALVQECQNKMDFLTLPAFKAMPLPTSCKLPAPKPKAFQRLQTEGLWVGIGTVGKAADRIAPRIRTKNGMSALIDAAEKAAREAARSERAESVRRMESFIDTLASRDKRVQEIKRSRLFVDDSAGAQSIDQRLHKVLLTNTFDLDMENFSFCILPQMLKRLSLLDEKGNEFPAALSRASRMPRRLAVSLLPDVHRAAQQHEGKWAEASPFSYPWQGVQNNILQHVVNFICEERVNHLSLHFDGARVDVDRVAATGSSEDFCKGCSERVHATTGYAVTLRNKEHSYFFDLLPAKSAAVVDEGGPRSNEDNKHLLLRGNCIPCAFAAVTGQWQSVRQVEDFRKCRDVAELLGTRFFPRASLLDCREGGYLLHAENGGLPHCVGAAIQGGSVVVVCEKGAARKMSVFDFEECYASALDMKMPRRARGWTGCWISWLLADGTMTARSATRSNINSRRHNENLNFFELLRAKGLAVDDYDSGAPSSAGDQLFRRGNCIPCASAAVTGQWQSVREKIVEQQVEDFRKYRDVAELLGTRFFPRTSLQDCKEGCYLLHAENGGLPHCVGAVIQCGEAAICEKGKAQKMSVSVFAECYARALDIKTVAASRLDDGIDDDESAQLDRLLELLAAGDDEGSEASCDEESCDEGTVDVRSELLRALKAEMDAAKAAVGRGRQSRCILCPFKEFDMSSPKAKRNLLTHLSNYHNPEKKSQRTGARQMGCGNYVASGAKQMKTVFAMFDPDRCRGKSQGRYLERSAQMLQQGVKPAPTCLKIDRDTRLLLDDAGPTFINAAAVRPWPSEGPTTLARRVGGTYYSHAFAEILFKEFMLNYGHVRPTRARIVVRCAEAGSQLTHLLPQKVPQWLELLEDLLIAPFVRAARDLHMQQLLDHDEFVHMSVDATIRAAMRIEVQANDRDSAEKRAAAPFDDTVAKRRILTVRGRTAAVAGRWPIASEAARNIKEMLQMRPPQAALDQCRSIATGEPSGELYGQL